jgi:glutaminyl-peptide cyclotransferase
MQAQMRYVINTLLILCIFISGCGDAVRKNETRQETERRPEGSRAAARLSGKIEKPADGDVFTTGDIIEIIFSPGRKTPEVVSARITVDGTEAEFSGTLPGSLFWNSAGQPVGSRQIRIITEYDDGTTENYPIRIVLKSDVVPRQYGFKVLNSYPHDIKAYTQGLVYHEGYLYESTGRYGESTLRKVDLETGEVLRSLNLDRELFGEGLCVHDGKLYQLTWESRVGFIYDIETFRLISRIHYQTEGWGLTSDGTYLLKSDGSHYLYILDPRYFSEVGRLEVFDHKGRVDKLNELEFKDGLIYANVYTTDEIVRIDRETGRVTGVIDLTGLLDQRYHHPDLDVLNGVAYDHENDRLFVTGKNWPRLFEIELVPE